VTTRARWTVGGVVFGLYTFGVGVLMGVAVDRWRFDQARDAVLDRYCAVTHLHAQIMAHDTVTEVQKIPRAPPLRARRPSPARLGAGTLSGGRPTRLIATFRWWRWRRS
jgi:hypothetical protein